LLNLQNRKPSKSNQNDTIKLKKFKEKLHSEEVYKRKVTDKIKTTKPFKRQAKDNALTAQKFNCLKNIFLKDMMVNKIHRGYVV